MEKSTKLRTVQLLLIGCFLATAATAQIDEMEPLPIDDTHEWLGPLLAEVDLTEDDLIAEGIMPGMPKSLLKTKGTSEQACTNCWVWLKPLYSARDLGPDTRITPEWKDQHVPGTYVVNQEKSSEWGTVILNDDHTYTCKKKAQISVNGERGFWYLKGDTVLLFQSKIETENLVQSVEEKCLMNKADFVIEVVDRNEELIVRHTTWPLMAGCDAPRVSSFDNDGNLKTKVEVKDHTYWVPVPFTFNMDVNYFRITLQYTQDELQRQTPTHGEAERLYWTGQHLIPMRTLKKQVKGERVHRFLLMYNKIP